MDSEDNSRFKIEQDFEYLGEDWWHWSIWIESDKTNLDLIDHVVYTLHPTFVKPVQKIKDRNTKFKLSTEGWGVFMIYAKVILKSEEELPLKHYLQLLYPDGKINNE